MLVSQYTGMIVEVEDVPKLVNFWGGERVFTLNGERTFEIFRKHVLLFKEVKIRGSHH